MLLYWYSVPSIYAHTTIPELYPIVVNIGILHSVLFLYHYWGKGGKPIDRGYKFLSRTLATASYTASRNRVVTVSPEQIEDK